MTNEIIHQLELVKQFSIGQTIYVTERSTYEVETVNLDKIDISIYSNTYAHVCFIFVDRLGNVVDCMKLEDFNRRFFTDVTAAYKAVDATKQEENK